MLLLYTRIIAILFAKLLNFDYLSRKLKKPHLSKILGHAAADVVAVAAVIFVLTILINQLNYHWLINTLNYQTKAAEVDASAELSRPWRSSTSRRSPGSRRLSKPLRTRNSNRHKASIRKAHRSRARLPITRSNNLLRSCPNRRKPNRTTWGRPR